ncbi:MAG: hypothetical protein CM15mP77_2100 [Synechococcus sp.]|nr:MAG: hypothetical protein CM15mP77_2100 [Synechococcus sp.]
MFWQVLERRIPESVNGASGDGGGRLRPIAISSMFIAAAMALLSFRCGKGLFPGVTTPLDGLWLCGARTFREFGIPGGRQWCPGGHGRRPAGWGQLLQELPALTPRQRLIAIAHAFARHSLQPPARMDMNTTPGSIPRN